MILKTGDNITTDHIMPAGSKVLPFRSNIPAISEFVFEKVDKTFPRRALEAKAAGRAGFIVGGTNYGQGSSREHAALAPMFLGVRAVITRSFARIHLANLINFGILPLTFQNAADYDNIAQGDTLELDVTGIGSGGVILKNATKGAAIPVAHTLTEKDIEMLRAGGALAVVKARNQAVAAAK